MAHGRHHPSHPEAGADLFRLAAAVRPGADDFLKCDDVGLEAAQHLRRAMRQRAAVESATPMDVIGDDAKRFTYHAVVSQKPAPKLKSERDVTCPCCGATLIIDLNLGRIVGHREAGSGLNIELSDAQRILAEEKQRREAAFDQSVTNERTRGDALSKRFEEALQQAKEEPITKPTRDFDLD
jgi:hypothetical protein